MERNTADFSLLDSKGLFNSLPLDTHNRFASEVLPGFWIDVSWLGDDSPLCITEELTLWNAEHT